MHAVVAAGGGALTLGAFTLQRSTDGEGSDDGERHDSVRKETTIDMDDMKT